MSDRSGDKIRHIFTGEYPPDPGGIADYSLLVATGLAEAGEEVHVWTTPTQDDSGNEEDPTVHRVAGSWSAADLARLDERLDAFPKPRRLLVQYAPNVWKQRGLNVGFCRFLRRRRSRGDRIRIMFHEVRYLSRPEDGFARRLLAIGQRYMSRIALKAATEVDVAIPYWERLLRAHDPIRNRAMRWAPVPSNIPTIDDPAGVSEIRRRFAAEGRVILGNFGTFHDVIGAMVAASLPPLIAGDRRRTGLLIGRGSEVFATRLIRSRPDLEGRLIAVGGLPAADVSRHLQACDLLVQPYPDGVCAKRGSLMAGLAHGLPTATTIGPISESIWTETDCVSTAPHDDPSALIAAAESLLAAPDRRRLLGERARRVYRDAFAIERTIESLLRDNDEPQGARRP